MSSTELHERLNSGEEFALVDVRSEDDYEAEHIPEAKNISLSELGETAPDALNKNQRVVIYGEDHDDTNSNNAAETLESLGFRKVSDFDGGLYAWKRAGFATEGNDKQRVKELG
jgi:rhodanese-related sulfurtransferase